MMVLVALEIEDGDCSLCTDRWRTAFIESSADVKVDGCCTELVVVEQRIEIDAITLDVAIETFRVVHAHVNR